MLVIPSKTPRQMFDSFPPLQFLLACSRSRQPSPVHSPCPKAQHPTADFAGRKLHAAVNTTNAAVKLQMQQLTRICSSVRSPVQFGKAHTNNSTCWAQPSLLRPTALVLATIIKPSTTNPEPSIIIPKPLILTPKPSINIPKPWITPPQTLNFHHTPLHLPLTTFHPGSPGHHSPAHRYDTTQWTLQPVWLVLVPCPPAPQRGDSPPSTKQKKPPEQKSSWSQHSLCPYTLVQ